MSHDDELLELHEFDKVQGHIYKITNTVTGKSYIGQTRTHRLNRKKYRPFGYLGRFKDHIHEAFSNKVGGCRYLNSSIQMYGADSFNCVLLLTCKVDELNDIETQYISEHKTKYPNGYNLTDGGKTVSIKRMEEITLIPQPKKQRIGIKRSPETRMLMSRRLKEYANDADVIKFRIKSAQAQHLNQKFERFKAVTVDKTKIDSYIFVVRNNKLNNEYVKVKIQKIKTTFTSNYDDISLIKERARTFIKELIEWQNTLLRETPIEPSLPL
jgi:hypothetical protein